MIDSKDFKKHIKRLKLENDLTQAEIAERLGVKSTYLSDMINGRVPVTESILNKIYELFSYQINADRDYIKEEGPSKKEDHSDIYYTYLIPMSAMGGSLVGFDVNGISSTDCERIVSPIAGVDFAISIYGDSMTPDFPSGSRVLIKQIDHTIYIEWGNVFVLDTTNGIIIKEVQPSSNKDSITCHSLNPNGKYKDFDVPLCEIRAMYKVLACVSMR